MEDLESLRKMKIKEIKVELDKHNIKWNTFVEKEEFVTALDKALKKAASFSCSGSIKPGKVAELTQDQAELEIKHGGTPLILDVHATWCGPCRMMAPELQKAAEQLGSTARVAKLDSDEFPELAETLSVSSLPTIIVFKEGKETTRVRGAIMVEEIVNMVS